LVKLSSIFQKYNNSPFFPILHKTPAGPQQATKKTQKQPLGAVLRVVWKSWILGEIWFYELEF